MRYSCSAPYCGKPSCSLQSVADSSQQRPKVHQRSSLALRECWAEPLDRWTHRSTIRTHPRFAATVSCDSIARLSIHLKSVSRSFTDARIGRFNRSAKV